VQIRPSNGAGYNNPVVPGGYGGIEFDGGSPNTGGFCIVPWSPTPGGMCIDGIGNATFFGNLTVNGKLTGTSGQQGPTGPQGPKGDTGAQGPQGTPGQVATTTFPVCMNGQTSGPYPANCGCANTPLQAIAISNGGACTVRAVQGACTAATTNQVGLKRSSYRRLYGFG